MQNHLWTGLAEKTQRYVDMGGMRTFYEALEAVYGLSYKIQAILRSSDGSTLLTDKEDILQRWSEHFEGLFSDRGTVQESSLAKIPEVDVKLELDDPTTREEIRKATMQMKVGKSPGIDGIPAEVYHHGGEAVLDKLQDLFTNCWEKGTLPQDLRNAVIVFLYQNKGEISDRSNYRGITLLSIAGKILARVLLNRLIPTIAQEISRKPVWIQVEQSHRRHNFRAEADTREMQRTEHGSICSCRRPDQGLWYCQP